MPLGEIDEEAAVVPVVLTMFDVLFSGLTSFYLLRIMPAVVLSMKMRFVWIPFGDVDKESC